MSDELSLRLDLLDRQIVDADELPIGRADDLALTVDDQGLRVDAILTGSQAIGERVGGWIGRTMARVSARLRPPSGDPGPAAIPMSLVSEVEDQIDLHVRLEDLPHVAGLEHWLAEHVIGPLPGAGDARE